MHRLQEILNRMIIALRSVAMHPAARLQRARRGESLVSPPRQVTGHKLHIRDICKSHKSNCDPQVPI
jgi:hypothetical protein